MINKTKVPRLLGLTLLLGASCYLWLLPLFRPRGDFLWGYYRLKDIYLGFPVGVALLCTLAVLAIPAKYRRALALRLVTVLVSLIFTVLLVDVIYAFILRGGLRPNFWLDQASIPRIYNVADDELGFVRKPGTSWRGHIDEADRFVDYRTDGNGFRNSAVHEPVADVVFVGDSFTEAVEVSEGDTFVRRVGNATGLSVVNLGRGGYGPQQEFIVLQKYGLAYSPRFVIWQLFEGNDLPDAEHFAVWKKNPQHSTTSIQDRYFAHSFITKLLTKTRVADRTTPWITFNYSDGTAARIPLNYIYEPSQPEQIPAGMEETNRTVQMVHEFCQTHRIRLMILFIPTMIRVMRPYVTFERKEDETRHLGQPSNKDFSRRVAEECARVGCSFIDSFAALRQAAAIDNRQLYIFGDEHLDIRGHEVIAQLVTDWIRKNNGDQRAGN
ncbi:MAG TPA: hypothetical protein VJM50_01060 [Pyrinomonadaceae bacterium]|nr:hypothetical protein [Pyrinomonadaceae bacterium]